MPETPLWLAAAEAVLNRNIAAQTRARTQARRLEGKTLSVEVTGVLTLRATCLGGRLLLGRALAEAPIAGRPDPGAADAMISGSPAALLAMSGGGNRPASGQAVQVRGDAEVAALYRDLLQAARPDWEEELSHWLGDVPAHRLGLLARRTLSWGRRARRSFGENIAEYLQEESRDLVGRVEVDEFLRGVDALRETGDRVDARLKRLERRLQDAG
jgi:ubiquinone biosynthesis protein UbiJ